MKPGDKVRCVDATDCMWLGEGNVYEIEGRQGNVLFMQGGRMYPKDRFEPVQEVPVSPTAITFRSVTIIFRTVQQASADGGVTWVDVPGVGK